MLTVIETQMFRQYANAVWNDEEREAFIDWIAENPDAGKVIPRATPLRKVRWGRAGTGKKAGCGSFTTRRSLMAQSACWWCTLNRLRTIFLRRSCGNCKNLWSKAMQKNDEMSLFEHDLLESFRQSRGGQNACVHTPEGIQARRRGRPAGSTIQVHKVPTTIRLDPEVISAFKSTGNGWQTRMNSALKDWLKTHAPQQA